MVDPEIIMPQISYIESLHKKVVGAACVLENEQKEILIMKPSYREGWLIPGGVLLPMESPKEGCVRKTKEEVGITIVEPTLIGVTHSLRRSDENERYESIHFIFFGGILTPEQIEEIHLQEKAFEQYRFAPLERARTLLDFPLNDRVAQSLTALDHHTVAYIELKQE